MTAPDGYHVNPAVLARAADAGAAIARDAGALPGELATALRELASGAPKTLSGSVAAHAGHWADACGHQVDRVQDLGVKLKQTADDYLREDEAAALTIGTVDPVLTSGPDGISAVLDGLAT